MKQEPKIIFCRATKGETRWWNVGERTIGEIREKLKLFGLTLDAIVYPKTAKVVAYTKYAKLVDEQDYLDDAKFHCPSSFE